MGLMEFPPGVPGGVLRRSILFLAAAELYDHDRPHWIMIMAAAKSQSQNDHRHSYPASWDYTRTLRATSSGLHHFSKKAARILWCLNSQLLLEATNAADRVHQSHVAPKYRQSSSAACLRTLAACRPGRSITISTIPLTSTTGVSLCPRPGNLRWEQFVPTSGY